MKLGFNPLIFTQRQGGRGWLALWLLAWLAGQTTAQTVGTEMDPAETPGERPYEMVWAQRREPAAPALQFAATSEWMMETEHGARAELRPSRAQNIWDRPVARLRYQGDGNSGSPAKISLTLRQSAPVPAEANCVELWVFGNRWDWEHPPGTPPVELRLRLRGAGQDPVTLSLGTIRWQEWWLVHWRLPANLKTPAVVEGLDIVGGWQPEPRDLYLDALTFLREDPAPLKFAPRPERNLTLFPGQSPGANTGPGRLPFPTREETILPLRLGPPGKTTVAGDATRGFEFAYRGGDDAITYQFKPAEGFNGLWVSYQGSPAWQPMAGAQLVYEKSTMTPRLISARLEQNQALAEYDDGTTLRLQLWNQSLVVDVWHPSGRVIAFDLGRSSATRDAFPFGVPFITFGWHEPKILFSRPGGQPVFSSLWLDWYRSNGSEFYGVDGAETNRTRINGGVRYRECTDQRRNPVYERLFITVSARLEEVLPVVPNPVGLHAAAATDRLWQESWGPEHYEKQMERSRVLRAYGIEKLIQCNHEITWRDRGESFTLRRKAAPKRGGDEALKRYVRHQKSLGWLAGLYSNYTDFSPVNEYWDPDFVQRLPDQDWRQGWPRCYALKPLRAVEKDAELAPYLKQTFQSTSAYTDVHTAVAPWTYNDYDARCPGAGAFSQTFYAYGELLRHDSRAYAAPIFSEGTYHWLYAGLADGNYALVYNGRSMANEPLLPVFDLLQIHPKECDIGMGWTEQFCGGIPEWNAPKNIDHSIDRFLLTTLAYGHIGWLVEEEHGWNRTARSYFMLQPIQARYGLKAPTQMRYWTGKELVDVSTAVAQKLPWTRRQLRIDYPGGLKLWVNDHHAETWSVEEGPNHWTLPPAGWAAATEDGAVTSFSGLSGTNRVDYLRGPEFVYLDGRGQWFDAPEAGASGSLAIFPAGANGLTIIRYSTAGEVLIKRPFQVKGALRECQAWDVKGAQLAAPEAKDTGDETRLTPVPGAIRYELRFEPQP
jgi:hypothetical protein